MKKTGTLICSLCIFLLWYGAALSASQPSISITGVVKQQLNLTTDDLRRFESVNVRLNEVATDRSYHGAFFYRGVPLRTLLELATVQKEAADFSKPVDLAIVVKNKDGKQTVLSWGEIFYRNPADSYHRIVCRAGHASPGMCELSPAGGIYPMVGAAQAPARNAEARCCKRFLF